MQPPKRSLVLIGACCLIVGLSPLAGACPTINPCPGDIDGNCVVDLADVVRFSNHYFGGYNPSSDLNNDGVINLSDISLLASAYGTVC